MEDRTEKLAGSSSWVVKAQGSIGGGSQVPEKVARDGLMEARREMLTGSPSWVGKAHGSIGGGSKAVEKGSRGGLVEDLTEILKEPQSWVEKVQGSNGGGIQAPEKVLRDDFVEARMEMTFPNGIDGEAAITIGQEVIEAMNGLYRQCMIVKVLGRHITIEALNRRLRELWRPQGSMLVLDLPKQFFMVRFEMEQDYLGAVTGGPWRVLGSILMVKAWSPSFDPMCDEIETTPVWVRISNLPVNFYHRAILMGIAAGVGAPIKVDMTTLKVTRARFAWVCLEVNLKKPLKGSVLVNGNRYIVSYEGLNNICPICGVFGHAVSVCPSRVSGRIAQQKQKEVGPNRGGEELGLSVDGFTEVRRQGRQALAPRVVFGAGGSGGSVGIIDNSQGNGHVSGELVTSNRFMKLGGEEEVPMMQEREKAVAENKENEAFQNLLTTGIPLVQGQGKVQEGKITGERIGLRGGEFKQRSMGTKFVRKGKPGKPNASMKGLVFGPIRGESRVFNSGKRLRVEQENVGRLGGVYSIGSPEIVAGEGQIQDRIIMTTMKGVTSTCGESSMELGLQEKLLSSDGVNEKK